ncbi:hypothetical protein KP509_07G011200 [Ceratopteris richardii]|uniref:Uncharacterized protein n=1 Tax=Ceratopteris richardii TaxID=49495 RepID=A0A8T2U9W1_CERRI|nr:hypothetical protein KP509_07G011200 [Ceratopteris richardii]
MYAPSQILKIVDRMFWVCYLDFQIQRARADDIEIFRAESISFPPAPSPSAPLNCTDACAHRCSKSGRPNRCKRACGTCCIRCSCVPPGTAGNHNVCGDCYARQKEPNGDQKCP